MADGRGQQKTKGLVSRAFRTLDSRLFIVHGLHGLGGCLKAKVKSNFSHRRTRTKAGLYVRRRARHTTVGLLRGFLSCLFRPLISDLRPLSSSVCGDLSAQRNRLTLTWKSRKFIKKPAFCLNRRFFLE
jgi:hypothetical protein